MALLDRIVADGYDRFLAPGRAGRGCNLDRDTKSRLADAGFDTSGIVEGNMPGLPWTKAAIRGTATPA